MNQPVIENPHNSSGVSLSEAWHAVDIAEVAQRLDANPSTGLVSNEATVRADRANGSLLIESVGLKQTFKCHWIV